MFCTQCGHEQNNGAKFCHNCGENHNNTESLKDASTSSKVSSVSGVDIRDFYVVSTGKFILLSIISFGLYDIFWFTRNWNMIKDQEKSNIWPIARAIFSIFFFSELATKTLKSAKERGYEKSYSPTFLAVAYFVSNILFRLPEIFWLLGFASILTFIPVLEAILYNNENSLNKVQSYDRFKIGEIITVIVGSIFWIFVLIGLSS